MKLVYDDNYCLISHIHASKLNAFLTFMSVYNYNLYFGKILSTSYRNGSDCKRTLYLSSISSHDHNMDCYFCVCVNSEVESMPFAFLLL